MLLGSIVPALIIGLGLSAYVYVWARRRPELRQPRSSVPDVAHAALSALPFLFTLVIVIGGILGGVVTPTEASALAVLYLLLLTALYRSINRRELFEVLRQSAETTGTVMLLVATSQLAAYILTLERAPYLVAELFLSFTDSQIVYLILLNVILLLAGIFFELSAMLVVLVAVLLPVSAAYDIDAIHLGVILIFNFLIGSVSPPVGPILSVIATALKVPLREVNKGAVPVLVPLTICLLLITFLPALTLWLPSTFGFGR
jgi:tripartite ATP-independent transporter DctM subunit